MKPRADRERTDATLRQERDKADAAFAKARLSSETDAEEALAAVRAQLDGAMAARRENADRAIAGASEPTWHVASERAAEDRAIAEERAAGDDRGRIERERREEALSALLILERIATDDGLLAERIHADDLLATRDEFLGMVSHDLRTFLAGITYSAALLEQHVNAAAKPDATVLKHAERVQRFAARMNRLIADLLDVVSLEAGMLKVAPQPRDASQLVREALDAFEGAYAAKGVELVARVASRSPMARLDHDRVVQVLANLLSNALKFTRPGGKVSLVVEDVGDAVRFSVLDTGEGIPPGREAQIFERFQQANTRDRRGLGLGLYISKGIVEAHGGQIWAERREAGGTAVRFALPTAAAVP